MPKIILRPGENALSIGIDGREVLTYDITGRPVTAYLHERTCRRGLDNTTLIIWREKVRGKRVKRRRFLSHSETMAFLEDIRARMISVNDIFLAGNARIVGSTDDGEPQSDTVARWLDRIVSLKPSTLAEDEDRFRSVYRPIGILPPDQYLSVILQGTEGCSHNRCTFCNFYDEVDFRIKSLDEFSQHILSVKEFFGEAIALRKAIFFADANAMVIPQERLVPMMKRINAEFLITDGRDRATGPRSRGTAAHAFAGINSFIDAFSGPMKSVADFAELRELSLRRLYLGLESGNDSLLRFINKPGTSGDALELVRRIKEAGLGAGIIAMAGIGGEQFSADHINDTVSLVKSMELGTGDILYISDFVSHPRSEYVKRCEAEGIEAISAEEILAQRGAIQGALDAQAAERGYKIAPYNIRNFIY